MRKGWEYKKLGEVCTLISDGSHNPPKGIDHSLYRMISSQNVFDDNLQISEDNVRYITESDHLCENKRTKLQKDVVLLTIVGTIGRSCVLKGNEGCLTLQRSVAALHPSDQIMPRYLMHCLIGNRHTLNQEAHGIAQKGIYLRQLSSLSIPLPPKSTQLAIVSELDKINELIRLKKKQLKDFDNLAQSLFYEMFGDPVENEKGWEVKKIKDIAKYYNGVAHEQDVDKDGDFVLINAKFISSEGQIKKYTSIQRFPLLKNDIVMVLSDLPNGKSLAKCFLIDEDNKYTLNQRICCFRGFEGSSVYLKNIINRNPYLLSFDNGKGQTNLRKGDVEKIPIPLPPLSLQRLFAQRIEQIEREKSKVQKSIQDLETLLASRMHYWFE